MTLTLGRGRRVASGEGLSERVGACVEAGEEDACAEAVACGEAGAAGAVVGADEVAAAPAPPSAPRGAWRGARSVSFGVGGTTAKGSMATAEHEVASSTQVSASVTSRRVPPGMSPRTVISPYREWR